MDAPCMDTQSDHTPIRTQHLDQTIAGPSLALLYLCGTFFCEAFRKLEVFRFLPGFKFQLKGFLGRLRNQPCNFDATLNLEYPCSNISRGWTITFPYCRVQLLKHVQVNIFPSPVWSGIFEPPLFESTVEVDSPDLHPVLVRSPVGRFFTFADGVSHHWGGHCKHWHEGLSERHS